MDEQEKFLKAIENIDGVENVKFFKGDNPELTVDMVCKEANHAIFSQKTGLCQSFNDWRERDDFPSVDVRTLVDIR